MDGAREHVRRGPSRTTPQQPQPAENKAEPAHHSSVIARGVVSGSPQDELGGTRVEAPLAERLARRRGSGRRLPSGLATDLGQRLSTNLSGVRVHDDPEAHTIARQVQSTAFTLGTDIYFSSGAFAPSTTPGKRLLAHELSHVAQSAGPGRGTGSGARPVIGRADDPVEREADRMADAALAGEPVHTDARGVRGTARRAPADSGTVRRIIGLTLPATVRGSKGKRAQKFTTDEEKIPEPFIYLAQACDRTDATRETGDSAMYSDKSTAGALDTAGATGAMGAIGAVSGAKGIYDNAWGAYQAGKQLKHGYAKYDFGLGDGPHSDTLSKNAGAAGMERSVTGIVQGGGGAAVGVTMMVSAGTEAIPFVADAVKFGNAALQTKQAVEDSVASAKLGASRRGIKHDQDLELPLDVRERRFGSFLKDMDGNAGGKSKRSDKKRYETERQKYLDKYNIEGWDPTAPENWRAWVNNDAKWARQKTHWLDYLRDNGIKDFGKGTSFRNEYKKSLKNADGKRTGKGSADYEQFRNLKKFSKFGQRRKAETASLNAVEAAGNALDAAGTFSASGDFGATKATGKVIKASTATYKGVKSLVKRGRRVHKLRTARNEAGYGDKKRTGIKGVWWGAKQFVAGDIDKRMEKTRNSINADGQQGDFKQSADLSADPAKKAALIHKLTKQCTRRINDLIACLLSDNERVRQQARKIVHIVAETNLAGAIQKINDRDLEILYRVATRMEQDGPDSDYTRDHTEEFERRTSVLKEILSKQLGGVGG